MTTGSVLWGLVALLAAVIFVRARRSASGLSFLEDEPRPDERVVVPLFEPSASRSAAAQPFVSALIAARDEGAAVTQGVGSLLAQRDVRMQVVAVDDRSGDDTWARLSALAAAHENVRSERVEALPEGWLGKVHALSVAEAHAEGDWLLFTDADVQLGPHAVRRAVALAERAGLDHVTVVPKYRCPNAPLEALVAASTNLLLAGTRAHEVGAPGKTAFLGLGAFNLVRTSRWRRAEGLTWLKMEVLDDMALALAVQRAGGRAAVRLSREEVCVQWYPSVGAMARGTCKIFWANAGYSPARLVLQAMLLSALAFGPIVALLQPSWVTKGLGVGALGALLGLALRRQRLGLQPLWTTLAGPLAQLGLVAFMLRALLSQGLRRRLEWRDTWYRFADLRRAQRVWRRRGTKPWPPEVTGPGEP